MRRRRLSIGTKFCLIVAFGTILVLGLAGSIFYRQIKSQDEAQTRQITDAVVEHVRAAVAIVFDSAFDLLNTTNESLVTFKDEGITDPQVYDAILKQMIDPHRYGAWLSWDADDAPVQPVSGAAATARPAAGMATYWHQNGIEMLKDTLPPEILASDLYQVPRKDRQAYLLEPHLIEATAGDPTLVTSFSKPLEHDGRIVGVVAVDIKLDAIVEALQAIRLPDGGSMTVMSDDGTIAMSSDGTPTGTQIGTKSKLWRILEQAKLGDGSDVASTSSGTGKVLTAWSRISFAEVANPWFLVLSMPQRTLLAGTATERIPLYFSAAVAVLGILALVFFTMHRLVAMPLKRLSAIIDGLGSGLFGFSVPGIERQDEVGDIARAVQHLQHSAEKIGRLQEENGETAYRHHVARRAEMDGISARFSQSIEALVKALDGAAATVEDRSHEVSTRASDAVRSLENMSAVSSTARARMASVANATTSLIETIGAIGDRTRKGESVSAKVERLASSTHLSLSELKTTIGSIDKVASLIGSVASHINLIALNATIEAARAGQAGLGFAVVAQEIKALAMQTAGATEAISRQVANVQQASGATDTNVAEMSKAFDEKRSISSEIAGALDIQLGATGAIRSMIDEAMSGADDVAGEVAALVESTHLVQEAATVMRSQSGLFNQEIAGLKREVAAFLDFLKAA